MTESKIYKSVLEKLSTIPIKYLVEVDQYLTSLKNDINFNEATNNIEEKSLAGRLSKESADLFVKHGQEIRNEWE